MSELQQVHLMALLIPALLALPYLPGLPSEHKPPLTRRSTPPHETNSVPTVRDTVERTDAPHPSPEAGAPPPRARSALTRPLNRERLTPHPGRHLRLITSTPPPPACPRPDTPPSEGGRS